MEVNDLKNIFYFIVAILWFVFSIYNKNKKSKKEETQPKKKPIPNIFEEVIKEFKKGIEEQVEPAPKTEPVRKISKKHHKKEIPEEVLAAQKRKTEREMALKNSRNEKFEESENQGALLDASSFQHNELQKMVIFTEIFKRPNY